MLRAIFTAFFCLITAAPVIAQDESRAILVLDASGSMWGQIEGVAKITIAQQVVGNLLNTLPQSQLLGLTVYGHRRKGDCSDIETLHLPGVDRTMIAASVNALSPRGKTPLSAAVIQAAEALKYTEEAATVILISDGIETCNLDPCEVGRQLEQTGVNFTAHVIGFNVTDPAAQAQLQCLAQETGGTYLPADNAGELADALQEVAQAPAPVSIPVTVTFRATEGEGGPVIDTDLVWTMGTDSTGILYENTLTGQISHDLMASTGEVHVLRRTDEASASTRFTVENSTITDGNMLITLVLPKRLPSATLMAADTAVAGALVGVTWTGPSGEKDYLSSAELGMANVVYVEYVDTRDSEGNVAMLRMPPVPGLYELRYVERSSQEVLARRNIQVTPLTIELDAPAQANAGSTIQVGWIGPDYKGDFLTIAKPGTDGQQYENYVNLTEGNPASLLMPTKPGVYEIRYVLNASRVIVGRVNIEVVEVLATLQAVDTALAGSDIQVTWSGPDYDNDYITVTEIGAGNTEYGSYTYTRDGNPVTITLPPKAGQFELRYVANQDKTILARRVINVEPVIATLAAPKTAAIGSKITVGWTGPGYERDHITITKPGESAGNYESYTYIRGGNPLSLQMPSAPGEYELRYIMDGSDDVILVRVPIIIEAASAQIKAPTSAPAGSRLVLDWQGPDEDRDHITVAKATDAPSHYESFTYTHDGSPLSLQMPTNPGEYELRYILGGTQRTILVRSPITITTVSATLDAPDSTVAGSELVINWTGPEGPRDQVVMAPLTDSPSNYESFVYVRNGNPLRLRMPTNPGDYELRYIAHGTERAALVRKVITVTPASATLDAPTVVSAGSILVANWTGPQNQRDHLTIAEPGANAGNYETFAYVREGNPLSLQVPSKPGTYELRYIIQGSDRAVLARQTLIVEPVIANLKAEASVAAGQDLIVDWVGPNFRNDYIAISRVDDLTGYEVFTYTRTGNPLSIKAPDVPGTYELRYVLNRDRVTITRQVLVVE